MREILNRKSKMIGKLFVFQIAMSLLGLFIVSPFTGDMHIYAAIFATLFYFSLIGYAVIEDGQKDCISFNVGRLNGSQFDGFIYAAVSYLPTLIVVILQVILQLATSITSFVGLKSILNALIRFLFMGMYLGFDTGLVQRGYDSVNQASVVLKGSDTLVFMSDKCLIFAICAVIMPIVCGIIYMLSFKGILHVDTTPKKRKIRKERSEES